MKKYITLLLGLATVCAFASPAFAGPKYLQYKLDIVVDGSPMYRSTPVRAPEGSMIGFSASSPTDKDEILIKLAARQTDQGFELAGAFEVKKDGKVEEKKSISDIVKGNDQGRFFFDYQGKSYEVLVTPSSWTHQS